MERHMLEEPEFGSRWLHVKRGMTYAYQGSCVIEATMTTGAIYRAEADGTTWVRPMAEFLDGRFVKL